MVSVLAWPRIRATVSIGQTSPKCGHRHKPSGRIYLYKNPECDFAGIRDIVGSTNIKNKYENGTFKPSHALPRWVAKYRRPVKAPVIRLNCVVPMTTGKLLDNTLDTAPALSSAGSKTPSWLFHAAWSRIPSACCAGVCQFTLQIPKPPRSN